MAAIMMTACQECELRGCIVPSTDGQTYLVVDDDNGGACGPIEVDGKPWKHPIHAAGLINPGTHTIACGGEIGFEIRKGTTFHFDYWGP
jgi:hypothetical protein